MAVTSISGFIIHSFASFFLYLPHMHTAGGQGPYLSYSVLYPRASGRSWTMEELSVGLLN